MKANAAPMVILGIPLFLITWLLCALITNALKLPAPGVVAALIAAAFMALMVWLRVRQLRKDLGKTSLVADSSGLTYTGAASRRHLAWSDIREVRRILPMRGVDAKKAARETHRQYAGRNGVDPQTGQAYVDIPLTQFATRWHEHRIGAWLAHYRPDLMDQARQVVEAHPASGGRA